MRSSVYLSIFLFIVCCTMSFPSTPYAAVFKPLNFGGRIVFMTPCTCSGNVLLYIQDVRGWVSPLVYQPGVTILHKWYQPRVGVWGLGNFVAGGVCLVYSGTACVTGGVPVGTMTQLGTSLYMNPAK